MMTLSQIELDLAMFRDGGVSAVWSFLSDPRFWALLITTIGAAAATLALADLVRRDRNSGGPTARLLADAIGLDRRDLRLLGFLARQAKLPSPACLMISRGCFDHATSRSPLDHDDPALARLRQRLFENWPQPVHCADERD